MWPDSYLQTLPFKCLLRALLTFLPLKLTFGLKYDSKIFLLFFFLKQFLVTNGSMPPFLLADSSLLLPSLDAKSHFHRKLKAPVKLSPWRPFPAPRKVVFVSFSDFHLLNGTFHLNGVLNLLSDNRC